MNNISIDVYNEGASKTPLVCIHGFLETKEMWSNLHLFFVDRPIICIDVPGHGQSEIAEDTNCSMETIASMIEESLRSMSIDKYDVIGHSMGGYIALSLLEQFPAQINKCILLNSNFLDDTEEKKKDRVRSLKMLAKYPKLYFKQAFEGLFIEPELHMDAINRLIEHAKGLNHFGIQFALEAMMFRKNQSNLVKMNSDRFFMIQGEKDAMFMDPVAYESVLPSAHWTTIKDSKHMSLIEQQQVTLEAVLTIIEK